MASASLARYNFGVRIKRILAVLASCVVATGLAAQEKSAPKPPQVRVNYLNVCSPDAASQKEMASALATIPLRPALAADFEVSRGRSTITGASPLDPNEAGAAAGNAEVASFVRIRHELVGGIYGNAQYSFSVDESGMTETLVLHARDMSKGVIQVSFQDSVSAGTPAAVLAASTPVERIRIEREGKPSLVLARCEGAKQGQYEDLFRTGSEILARYRAALRVRQNVPGDLARITDTRSGRKSSRNPSAKVGRARDTAGPK